MYLMAAILYGTNLEGKAAKKIKSNESLWSVAQKEMHIVLQR